MRQEAGLRSPLARVVRRSYLRRNSTAPHTKPYSYMAPLSDVRVCDLTQNLAGPFCCQILGDMGAQVVKVEPPGGDPARAWGPPFWGSESTLSLSVNRNKRSVVLDLKGPRGREVLHSLAKTSDVLVQSSRVGVPERLGYDYETIRGLREDVIHMSITAFGPEGPMRAYPGYDPLMQAFAGIISVTGYPESPPVRVGGSVVDYGTGMWAAIAILGALRERDRTGKGARLDTCLMDTTIGWVAYHLMGYFATGDVPRKMGTGLESVVPYQAFRTTDGYVMIAGGNDGIFVRLCTALGIEEVGRDPRFRTNPDRVAHREPLIEILEGRTMRFTTEELLAILHRHAVPGSPIQDIAQVAGDPQVMASGILTEAYPELPGYRDVAIPLRVDGARPRGDRPPPHAGADTVEILRELGFDEAEVAAMLEDGTVAAWDPA
jgi:crotonobetainyl-CoA:carnitine CoA-transferase CaiB-like acyl-CoA transferase